MGPPFSRLVKVFHSHSFARPRRYRARGLNSWLSGASGARAASTVPVEAGLLG